MSIASLITASTLAFTAIPAADTNEPQGMLLAQTAPTISTQGVVTPQSGEYKTLSNGCVYARTQAPGYPARWILVVNPQRLGMNSKRTGRCPGMM